MSELNKKQLKYFHMAKSIQEGKVTLPKKDLRLFIKCIKELTDPRFKGMTDTQTDLRTDITPSSSTGGTPIEPMYLEGEELNTERNPVAKSFQQKGNFEQYIQRFSGLEIKPKEMESISNYAKSKPTKQDEFSVRYEDSDGFNNNTITVIKKLREGNDLVFTAFQVNTPQTTDDMKNKPEVEGDDIIVTKSVSFRDEIEGGNILSDLLQKLDV